VEIVVSSEPVPSGEKTAEREDGEKIVGRETVVYETRIEPTVIQSIGEKIKAQLFTRFGFMKPSPEEIQLVSIDKYYEPYMRVSGRYAIDYYRKSVYTVGVDNKVDEVVLSNQKYKPSRPSDRFAGDRNIIRIQGEERMKIEAKASLMLDRFGQEVSPEQFPISTTEEKPDEILAAFGVKEIPPEADLNIIRSRIFRRPKDIHRLVTEVFEVHERALIYAPRFRVLYTNIRTGEGKSVEFDGVSAQRTQRPRPLSSQPQRMT
jgi:hypothetical protein